jgi:hypothetical protein
VSDLEYLHYVRKADILQSTVYGDAVAALCGESGLFSGCGLRSARGTVDGNVVCPKCLAMYGLLPASNAVQKPMQAVA